MYPKTGFDNKNILNSVCCTKCFQMPTEFSYSELIAYLPHYFALNIQMTVVYLHTTFMNSSIFLQIDWVREGSSKGEDGGTGEPTIIATGRKVVVNNKRFRVNQKLLS